MGSCRGENTPQIVYNSPLDQFTVACVVIKQKASTVMIPFHSCVDSKWKQTIFLSEKYKGTNASGQNFK